MNTINANPIIQTLLQRASAGEAHAFSDVVRHYQRPLFSFLGRMGLAQAQAEDIAQETFLRAWTSLVSYKPELAQFSTWLFTIARNLALNELSRASVKHAVADREISNNDMSGAELRPEASCPQLQPPEQLALAQQQRQLQAALRQLPLPDRSIIALAYIQELDMTAIARIENCSPGAIKTRLHRARQRLRELLEKHYVE